MPDLNTVPREYPLPPVFARNDLYKRGWAHGFYGCPVQPWQEEFLSAAARAEFCKGYRDGCVARTRDSRELESIYAREAYAC